MTDRWKMNRLGFINFWLYDNEVFPLDHGHILLRGQNGSGKSITTQSFIPFILDGDRTPSRLDPFGSDARRMDYYFLGDGTGSKEDVTGYLYLEFVKEETGEYRTLGIGQRAQKGKNGLGFWGFILMDGRRIGFDGCSLSKKLSEGSYLPLSRKECRDHIGQGNFFTEQQKEYKEAVNHYLFGFERMEQYDQFIRLLVKVRAPKLSKEFKPSKVYDILNDSLQTLSNEDISPMVQAMEKMDEIHTRLEGLKNTRDQLRYILKEYHNYNAITAARKAESYLTAEAAWTQNEKACEALLKQQKQMEKDLQKASDSLASLRQEVKVLEAKEDAYQQSDIASQLSRRTKLTSQIAEVKKKEEIRQDTIDTLAGEIHQLDVKIREYDADSAANRKEMERLLKLLDEMNVQLQFADHDHFALMKDMHAKDDFSLLRSELNDLSSDIATIRKKLDQMAQAAEALDGAEEKQSRLEKELAEIQKQLSEAEEQIDALKDQVSEGWYLFHQNTSELQVDDETLQKLIRIIRSYTPADAYDYAELCSSIRSKARLSLQLLLKQNEQDLIDQNEILKQLRKELNNLQNETEAIPGRSERVQACRKTLQEKGIEVIPFYEAIDFSDVDDKRQIMLEEQLEAAGLLDALVIRKEDQTAAEEIMQAYTDLFITPLEPHEACSFFRVSESNMSEGMKAEVREILACMGEDDSQFVLRDDGYFRNGVLSGYVRPLENDAVTYIGVETRRRRHAEQLAEKQAEIDTAQQERENLLKEKQQLKAREGVQEEEAGKMPSIRDLNASFDVLNRLQNQEAASLDALKDQKEIVRRRKYDYQAKRHDAEEAMRPYPYEHTRAAYEAVSETLSDYQTEAENFHDVRKDEQNNQDQKAYAEGRQSDKEDEKERAEDDLSALKKDGEQAEGELAAVEEILNAPETKKLVEEMDVIRRKKAEDAQSINVLIAETSRLQANLNNMQEKIESREKETAEAEQKKNLSRTYYIEDMRLNLLEDVSDRDDEAVAAMALKIKDAVSEDNRRKETADIVNHLNKTFNVHSQQIRENNLLIETEFEESEMPGLDRRRSVITAELSGRRVDLNVYNDHILNSIDETEQLINQKDRELFENILSNTLSRKLIERISESRKWISDMSKLMKNMDSSMGLNFAMRWVPKAAESDSQLSTDQLERILSRDSALLREEDKHKVAEHFRAEINMKRQEVIDNGGILNYTELVRDALDYRQWFEFRLYFQRTNENVKELTDRQFNTLSGGEKAMAMYIPLFAAVNAQYLKARKQDHPRLIALDEAFAGVDEKNIASMFRLVGSLDFDYIMNSQSLWGCYDTVQALRIAELLRPENADFVTVIFYHWNGKERILDDHG